MTEETKDTGRTETEKRDKEKKPPKKKTPSKRRGRGGKPEATLRFEGSVAAAFGYFGLFLLSALFPFRLRPLFDFSLLDVVVCQPVSPTQFAKYGLKAAAKGRPRLPIAAIFENPHSMVFNGLRIFGLIDVSRQDEFHQPLGQLEIPPGGSLCPGKRFYA